MRKILLLVFIHGFKGSDETFNKFPTDLSAQLALSLPNITITPLVYPSFETRGDLESTVSRFREWLENKVVDIEVERGTKNPMLENGVRVVIIGHSMGGIVAAEAVLGIAGKKQQTQSDAHGEPQGQDEKVVKEEDEEHAIIFPYVQGLLAFDTPYLGLAPSMISHGMEAHYNTGKSYFDTASSLWSAIRSVSPTKAATSSPPAGALPPPAVPGTQEAAATGNAWSGWGKYAMYGGAAASLASAGAVAAYFNRETISTGVTSATTGITSGWTWVTSHLEFVGCLARAEDLQRRLAGVSALAEVEMPSSPSVATGESEGVRSKMPTGRTIGFANLYTVLGKGAKSYEGEQKATGEQERRFCNLPRSDKLKEHWQPTKNDIAEDEVAAHVAMFTPDENTDYYRMTERARDLIAKWTERAWYETSATEDNDDEEMLE